MHREGLSERPFHHRDIRLWYPPDLGDFLNTALKAEPKRLAVFVSGIENHWYSRWEPLLSDLLDDLLNNVPGGRTQDAETPHIVRLARRDQARREPLRLPLRVAAVGEQVGGSFRALRARPWFQEEIIEQYGFELRELSLTEYRDRGKTEATDVVLCSDRLAADLLRLYARQELRVFRQPRLVAVLDSATDEESWMSLCPGPNVPRGVSLLWLPLTSTAEAAEEVVKALLYAITHDKPLHGLLTELERVRNFLRESPRLVADPSSVQDLRLGDAVEPIVDELTHLETTDYPGNVSHFLERVRPHAPPQTLADLQRLAQLVEPLDELFREADYLHAADFSEEGRGLVPLARLLSRKAEVDRGRHEIRQRLNDLAKDPASRDLFASHQNRCVDIALRRVEASPFCDPYVRPTQSLRRATKYRLRVQIGRRLQISLIRDEAPPLDPLLPEPDGRRGHLLHVAVFAFDFTLVSAPLLPLYLPSLGGSDPVHFNLVTPDKWDTARLRVAVYYDLPPGQDPAREQDYRNHLLQSFLLEARVDDEESVRSQLGTQVRLEFSRSSRLNDLEGLPRRVLSLGLNQRLQGTHDITLKQGGETAAVHVTEESMGTELKAVREVLYQATRKDEGGPRFPEGPARMADREDLFNNYLRQLAVKGRALYNRLWNNLPEAFQGRLAQLFDSTDEIIQIVRYDQNYLFPWSVLYDFPIPKQIARGTPVKVCDGFRREDKNSQRYSCRRCLEECKFPDKAGTYCVYGFWGLRHQVEQLLHTPFQNENRIGSVRPRRPHGLFVSVGLKDGFAGQLLKDLTEHDDHQYVRELQPKENLLDLLWDTAQRPWLVLLLGHYEQEDVEEEPSGPRMGLPGEGWLQAEDITSRSQRKDSEKKWSTDPHPIILLAACESAAEDLRTLTGFLSAFANVRAAAVVGTETVIYEGLASRFGKAVVDALLKNQSLGQAVLSFRRMLVMEWNPLGLVFTPYGDADLFVEATPVAAPVAVPVGAAGG